jgi:hypothetical protein
MNGLTTILLVLLSLVLATGCTVVRKPFDHHDQEGKPQARVVVVLCLFASCHHVVAPPERSTDEQCVE